MFQSIVQCLKKILGMALIHRPWFHTALGSPVLDFVRKLDDQGAFRCHLHCSRLDNLSVLESSLMCRVFSCLERRKEFASLKGTSDHRVGLQTCRVDHLLVLSAVKLLGLRFLSHTAL